MIQLPKKRLEELFTNYYGRQYNPLIYHRLNNLITSFEDNPMSKSKMESLKSELSFWQYLQLDYSNSAKVYEYEKIMFKYLDRLYQDLASNFGIEKEFFYDHLTLFIDNMFGKGEIDFYLNYRHAEDNGLDVPLDKFKQTRDLILRYRLKTKDLEFITFLRDAFQKCFLNDLYTIEPYKSISEKIKADEDIRLTILDSVTLNIPFVSHYLDKDEHWKNFLYFPYYYILSKDSNINVALLHELIHVVESTPKSIGLTDGKVGVLNNEIRTDFLAMELNKKLKKPLVPNDNLIEGEYHNFYLTISEPFHDFYKENWDLLGHLAIKGNLELLSKIYGDYWNYFLEETDKLYFVTKYVSENFGKNAQSIEYDYRMIHYLVHKMKVEKEKNLKKIKIR